MKVYGLAVTKESLWNWARHFIWVGFREDGIWIGGIFQNEIGMLWTGYAALSGNGAMEKPGSVATCFSLRSDEARAAASGARAVAGGSAKTWALVTPAVYSRGGALFVYSDR